MTSSVLTHRSPHPSIPDAISSSRGKLVYLYLQQVDRATIDDVGADLGLSHLSALPVIDHLVDLNVVARSGDELRAIT